MIRKFQIYTKVMGKVNEATCIPYLTYKIFNWFMTSLVSSILLSTLLTLTRIIMQWITDILLFYTHIFFNPLKDKFLKIYNCSVIIKPLKINISLTSLNNQPVANIPILFSWIIKTRCTYWQWFHKYFMLHICLPHPFEIYLLKKLACGIPHW